MDRHISKNNQQLSSNWAFAGLAVISVAKRLIFRLLYPTRNIHICEMLVFTLYKNNKDLKPAEAAGIVGTTLNATEM